MQSHGTEQRLLDELAVWRALYARARARPAAEVAAARADMIALAPGLVALLNPAPPTPFARAAQILGAGGAPPPSPPPVSESGAERGGEGGSAPPEGGSAPPRGARYRAAFEAATRTPLCMGRDNFRVLEEMWLGFARMFGFDTPYLDQMLEIRGNAMAVFGVGAADIVATSDRYVWCSVFAFLWVAAKHVTSDYQRRECTVLCNRFLGPSFDCFCQILAVVDEVAGIFPEHLGLQLAFYANIR